jgi:hypothetical protein
MDISLVPNDVRPSGNGCSDLQVVTNFVGSCCDLLKTVVLGFFLISGFCVSGVGPAGSKMR